MGFLVMTRSTVGTCGFRLYPDDELATGPAHVHVRTVAGGEGLLVCYGWTHPTDGNCEGMVLVTGMEDGGVRATWLDSWHQKPEPMVLEGTRDGNIVEVAGTYAETWGWQIRLDAPVEGPVTLVMRNVVPTEVTDAQGRENPGPYVVMDLTA